MSWKYALLIGFSVAILLGTPLACNYLGRDPIASQVSLATAAYRDLQLLVSTNGIIEPVDRSVIYAPIDGFVANLQKREGTEVARGEILMCLESKQVTTSLAEARAGLLQARLQAMPVLSGPSKAEIVAMDASIAENDLQLKQKREVLESEEALLQKGAVTRERVENLKMELNLLQLQGENLREKKQALLERFSSDQRRLEQDRIGQISRQVELLEAQVKAGAYVNRGQQLAEMYEPGRVRLRAYVDEPDLGGIAKGQPVLVEWDGLPDRQWRGNVERPADQVVELGNRSVGYVICSIEGETKELIPNINVKVQIVAAARSHTLVLPRSCVSSYKGQPAVIVWDGKNSDRRPVRLGLITPHDVEILQGINEGTRVVTNPAVIPNQ